MVGVLALTRLSGPSLRRFMKRFFNQVLEMVLVTTILATPFFIALWALFM